VLLISARDDSSLRHTPEITHSTTVVLQSTPSLHHLINEGLYAWYRQVPNFYSQNSMLEQTWWINKTK
jgi:hypothetical protein